MRHRDWQVEDHPEMDTAIAEGLKKLKAVSSNVTTTNGTIQSRLTGDSAVPYAMDYIYMSSVPGQPPSLGSDLLLGLRISLGNAIVGFIGEVRGALRKSHLSLRVAGASCPASHQTRRRARGAPRRSGACRIQNMRNYIICPIKASNGSCKTHVPFRVSPIFTIISPFHHFKW